MTSPTLASKEDHIRINAIVDGIEDVIDGNELADIMYAISIIIAKAYVNYGKDRDIEPIFKVLRATVKETVKQLQENKVAH
jgi:hypothetical protein